MKERAYETLDGGDQDFSKKGLMAAQLELQDHP